VDGTGISHFINNPGVVVGGVIKLLGRILVQKENMPDDVRQNQSEKEKLQRLVILMSATLLAATLLTLALAPPAVASSATYSFNLLGPQTAEDPTPITPSR